MTTTTVGTGTITLGSAATVNGVLYLSFAAAGVADGDIVAYGIQDTNNSEYGYGTYTSAGTTLTRTVIRSTNSNNAISLSGSAQVFVTAGNAELLWSYNAGARNYSLAASVAGNALTIALKDDAGADPAANSPVLIPFRSATAATGTVTWQAVRAATSLTVSSGSTLGTTNSTAFRLTVVLFDDSGTLRLGVINPTLTVVNDTVVASSTAEGGAGAADSANVYYTGTAVTSKAFRVLGYLDYPSGLGTAGTWSAAPTTIGLGPAIPGQVSASSASRLLGTTTNDSALTGYVGEVQTASVSSGSAVSLTTAVAANVTSISLTAGDWDVWGNVSFTGNASTTVTFLQGSVSTTSAAINATNVMTVSSPNGTFWYANNQPNTVCPPVRVSINSTTTVYLTTYAEFAVSTNGAYGSITARRRR